MINEVRNTVLSILAKDNRGYITPLEFNLYAKQAQLDVFERYIYLYSNAMIKQNQRMHGEGYSDVPKKLSEVTVAPDIVGTLNVAVYLCHVVPITFEAAYEESNVALFVLLS